MAPWKALPMDALASPRPLSFVGILAATLRIYRGHLLIFVAILAIYEVVHHATFLALQPAQSAFSSVAITRPPDGLRAQLGTPLFTGIGLLVNTLDLILLNILRGLSFAACVYAAGQAYIEGREGVGVAYRKALTCLGVTAGAVALSVVVLVLYFGVLYNIVHTIIYQALSSLLTMSARISLFSVIGSPDFFCLVALGIPVTVYLGVRLSMTLCALMFEGPGIRAALSRSGDLVRGNWWRVFGILLALAVIYLFVTTAALIAVQAVPGVGKLTVANGDTVSALLNALVGAFPPIGATVLYYDLRARKESLAVVAS